jgi:hypothetical protein
MSRTTLELRLERLLTALGLEVAEATDEEVLAAAEDLGMKPLMKGSAAFFGLKYPCVPYDPGKLGEIDTWVDEPPPMPPWKRGRVD